MQDICPPLFKRNMGLTGIDRMNNYARKHAGSWSESLER